MAAAPLGAERSEGARDDARHTSEDMKTSSTLNRRVG